MVLDPTGNLYGTTFSTVYKLDTTGPVTVLATATPPYPEIYFIYAGLLRDSTGDLFGTSFYGGSRAGAGVVYELDTAGDLSSVYNFPFDHREWLHGCDPTSGVTIDGAGNFYGTAICGGTGHWGVVYKVRKDGGEKVLHNFTGGVDGGAPCAGVTRDSAGNIYGTTAQGGAGFGVVYRVDSSGNQTVLHTFTGGADGASPSAGIILGPNGNLYGTTCSGGIANSNCTSGCGVVYKLDRAGREAVLYSFTGGADGSCPYGQRGFCAY